MKSGKKTLKRYTGDEAKGMDEGVVARPDGLCENAETAVSCRAPEPARKKRYTSIAGRRRE